MQLNAAVQRDNSRQHHPQTSRNTNPRLTLTRRIGATAAVKAVGAGAAGQLIIGCIPKELVCAGRTMDLIRTPAATHEIIADFSECLVIVGAT
jgi:hypothetical protein